MTAWHVYILRCADGTLYTGIAADLAKRFTVHQHGRGAKYTRGRLPVKLVYKEQYRTKGKALRREAEIKKLRKRQKEALVRCGATTGRHARRRSIVGELQQRPI